MVVNTPPLPSSQNKEQGTGTHDTAEPNPNPFVSISTLQLAFRPCHYLQLLKKKIPLIFLEMIHQIFPCS